MQWQTTKANISFQIKNAGLVIKGSFSGLEAHLNFDPQDLSNSQLKGSIKAESINTANSMRDIHLRMPDYFRVIKYPTLEMTSTKISSHPTGYLGMFDLTIKGKTQQKKIPFSVDIQESKAVFKAQFELNRLDFGIGGRSFILSYNFV